MFRHGGKFTDFSSFEHGHDSNCSAEDCQASELHIQQVQKDLNNFILSTKGNVSEEHVDLVANIRTGGGFFYYFF